MHFDSFERRGGLVELVPLVCVPSNEFRDTGYDFRTQRDLIRFKQPMFRGVGPEDYQLARMPDLEIRLDKLVPSDTTYRIAYRMNEDKIIELRVSFEAGGTYTVVVDPFSGRQESTPSAFQLCRVNPIGGQQ